jgi:diguanylate cyclase (GGDEF)-like protein/PAS domain S-box-containing protein
MGTLMPKPTVLVVTSDSKDRSTLERLLSAEGYSPVFASDVKAARQAMTDAPPELTLCSAQMAGATPLEFLRALRREDRDSQVIVLVSKADEALRERALEAQADELLTTPVDAIDLRAKLSLLARLRRVRGLDLEHSDADTLVDHCPAAWILVGRDLIVRRANRAMAKLLAAGGSGRLEGSSLTEVAGEDPSALHDVIARAFESDGGGSVELEVHRRDGRTFAAVIEASRTPGAAELVQVVMSDISELRRYQSELERSAYTDALTGLPNRGLLNDRLQVAVFDAMRSNEGVAVLVVNLDRFHLLNDAFGFEEGNRILTTMGLTLTNLIRPDETAARLGGGEFALVLRGFHNSQQIVTRCKSILGELTKPMHIQDRPVTITPSIGVALFPHDTTVPSELLRDASIAARRAHAAGGNTVRYYAPDMETRSHLRVDIETRLRQAMLKNELRLNYQPKVSLGSQMVCGAEALLRWTDADRGAIPPNEFIPIAEETDLILGLGAWVIQRVCHILAERSNLGYIDLPISVNVSARQFAEQDVPELVQNALAASGANPELLHIEITEGLLLNDSGRTIHSLTSLRDLGLKLALDDFGTGYSSLRYLKKLPLDYVKIDQCFVRGMQEDDRDQAMVETIVKMSHRLGFRVIAEGVESAWQARFLQEVGCDEAQGYLFEKPMAEDEFMCLVPVSLAPTRRRQTLLRSVV